MNGWRLSAIVLFAACHPAQRPSRALAPRWAEPRNLGSAVNGPSDDVKPAISPDGASLYFSSNRPGGSGRFDLYVAHRSARDAPWQAARNLGPILNSDHAESAVAFSPDGRQIFFGSDRSGGCGGMDLWVSTRRDPHDDDAWEAPTNLGCDVNGAGFDDGPAYVEHGDEATLYFISGRPGGPGDYDVYRSTRRGQAAWSAPELVRELSSPVRDARPAVRGDGLEFFVSSPRPGSAAVDIWVSVRADRRAPWGSPVLVGPPVDTPFIDGAPTLTRDGAVMFFNSDRPGGLGGFDLYTTSR